MGHHQNNILTRYYDVDKNNIACCTADLVRSGNLSITPAAKNSINDDCSTPLTLPKNSDDQLIYDEESCAARSAQVHITHQDSLLLSSWSSSASPVTEIKRQIDTTVYRSVCGSWFKILLFFLLFACAMRAQDFTLSVGVPFLGRPPLRNSDNDSDVSMEDFSWVQYSKQQAAEALILRAHSHNDYLQKLPLWSALQHGLTSIEVDVFPMKSAGSQHQQQQRPQLQGQDQISQQDQLWVGHTSFDLDPNRRIDNMYIRPLLSYLNGKQDQEQEQHLQQQTNSNGPPSDNSPLWASGIHYSNSTDTHPQQWEVPRGGKALTTRRRPPTKSSPMSSSTKANKNKEDQDQYDLYDSGTLLMAPSKDHLTLLVDFKGDADRTAMLLNLVIQPLRPHLSRVDAVHGTFTRGRLTIMVSGNRPSDASLVDPATGNRYLFVDGRISTDLRLRRQRQQEFDSPPPPPPELVPMISFPWHALRLHRWFHGCSGTVHYMRQLAEEAHAQGRILRIWGAPDEEYIWRELIDGHIDILSIDDHAKYVRFAMRDIYRR